jgi:hypothetical protein
MTLISTTTDALPAASARDRRPVDYLSRYSIRMEDTIPEVEAALVNGTIEEVLTRPAVSEVIGPDLTGRYRRIAGYKIKHDATFRRSWTQRFLATFKVSLQEPRALFPASSATRNPNPVRREIGHPRRPSILAAYRDTLVTLRPDQVLSARRWGFWFDFDDELLERAYADFLLKVARQELSSQIESLWKIEATYLSGKSKLKPNTEWSFGHR